MIQETMDFNSDTTNPANRPLSKFVSPGILLFIDQLIVAAGGWIYWLIISKLTMASEIGQATAVSSLIMLIAALTELGLEYPLLKKSSSERAQILGTVLIIELVINIAAIPIVLYFVNSIYQSSEAFAWVAAGMLIFSASSFVARFALLGTSNVMSILIIDIAGMTLKFVIGYALVENGYGAFGMLVSFLIHSVVITGATLAVARKTFEFRLGDSRFIKEIFKDGLINTPSKISRIIIISLSIVLLASFNISDTDIGIFYMALMISIVAGSLASSLAFMVIPASSISQADMSAGSMKLGLNLTAPLIAALLVVPGPILSTIGEEYASAGEIMMILSAGILPSIIVINTISRLNNRNHSKRLMAIGFIETSTFLIAFFVLVPYYGIVGAAFSIFIAFVTTSILPIIWSERILLRHIAVSIIAIITGVAVGYGTSLITESSAILAISAIGTTFIIAIVLKNTSITEMTQLIRDIIKK